MTTTPSKQSVNGAEPGHAAGSRRHRRGFWVVASGFLVVMALGTVPSPLYGSGLLAVRCGASSVSQDSFRLGARLPIPALTAGSDQPHPGPPCEANGTEPQLPGACDVRAGTGGRPPASITASARPNPDPGAPPNRSGRRRAPFSQTHGAFLSLFLGRDPRSAVPLDNDGPITVGTDSSVANIPRR